MKLKAIVEDLEKVDEKFRDLYKQDDDGMYVLNVEPVDGYSLENVEGLKNTLSKVNKENRTLTRDLKKFEGLDPEEARKAQEKLDELGDLDPNKEADRIAHEKIESQKEKLMKPLKEENESLSTRAKALQDQLQKAVVENQAMTALSEFGGSARLLMPHINQRVKLHEENGEFQVQVLDEDGEPRIKADRQGNTSPMSVKDLVAEMHESEEFAPAFEGTGQSGGGTPPNQRPTRNKGGVRILDRSSNPRELGESLEDIAEGKASFAAE